MLVKIYLCVIINSREILDVWLRQLSPHVILSRRRDCYDRNGLILFYRLITYIQE